LLEHCGEVAALCDPCASTLPHLNRDLLVTAAMLHDIGKLEEMESGLRSGEYTLAGQLVGHVVLGTYTVTRAADSLEDFPPVLLHELMHLILSHHGRPEHGAARPPLCAEAVVLSLCDLMSARVAQCHEAAGNGGDEPFQKIFGWDEGSVYLAMMRESMREHAAQEPGPA
jgi:3'-5' exoribonuclease